jgi:hypothetical protein
MAVVARLGRAMVATVLAALAGGCLDEPPPTAGRVPAAAAARPTLTPKQRDECRDQCEQGQLVAGTSDDAALRACRARCDRLAGIASGGGGGAIGPHEVPSRITKAPATREPRKYTTPAPR